MPLNGISFSFSIKIELGFKMCRWFLDFDTRSLVVYRLKDILPLKVTTDFISVTLGLTSSIQYGLKATHATTWEVEEGIEDIYTTLVQHHKLIWVQLSNLVPEITHELLKLTSENELRGHNQVWCQAFHLCFSIHLCFSSQVFTLAVRINGEMGVSWKALVGS